MPTGRGLESLIRSKKSGSKKSSVKSRRSTVASGEGVFLLEVRDISSNPEQPRKEFSKTGLTTLAASIREHGILEPLVVEKVTRSTRRGVTVKYRLIAGERRLRAAKKAGLARVPVVIRVARDDRYRLLLSLVENIQREDLNPVERAEAFKRLQNDFGLTHDEISQRVDKSREYVSNSLRLLSLEPEILRSVRIGEITEGHARALLSLPKTQRKELFVKMKSAPMSVREAEAASRLLAAQARMVPVRQADPERARIEDQLRQTLGVPVRLTRRGRRGSIAIIYTSREELEALLKKLLGHD